MMLWLAGVLIVVSVVSFVVGLVVFANATGVAPRRRTAEDPTGVKRATSRVEWPDVFRRMPSSLPVVLDKNTNKDDRRAAVGSLAVLAAVLAGCGAVLALIAAFV